MLTLNLKLNYPLVFPLTWRLGFLVSQVAFSSFTHNFCILSIVIKLECLFCINDKMKIYFKANKCPYMKETLPIINCLKCDRYNQPNLVCFYIYIKKILQINIKLKFLNSSALCKSKQNQNVNILCIKFIDTIILYPKGYTNNQNQVYSTHIHLNLCLQVMNS